MPSVHAASSLILEEVKYSYFAGLYASILEDPAGDLTIKQVSSPAWQDKFFVSQGKVQSFGITSSAYWFRLEIKNPADLKNRYLALEIAPPTLDYVDVYIGHGSDWQHWATGDTKPFAQRPFNHRNFVFPFEIASGQTKSIYIRTQTAFTLRPFVTLTDTMQFAIKQQNDTWVIGMIYGVIIIMALYNLFILFAIREQVYLYYVIFSLSILFNSLTTFGYGFQYLWPDSPWLNKSLFGVTSYLMVIATLLLTQQFLDLKRYARRLNLALNVLIAIACFFMVFSIFSPLTPTIGLGIVMFVMVFIWFVSGYAWFKGIPGATYLMLAWSGYFISILAAFAVGMGFLPDNALTRNFAALGFITLVVVMSFALADRLNRLRIERMEAQERALEEAEAKQKITEENFSLQRENLRMSTELDVTRQLQEMVLPTPEELSSVKQLDIACWMKSADEVGGDYYDVLQYHDKIIIGMGDVTGHGLASGVLMLMTQTAVRTLSICDMDDPADFFSVLNQAMYDNVQRMNIDKSLTLVVLDYQDGHVRISGQHEEILVVRQNGDIERVDTFELGFMIGIVHNIDDFVGIYDISLQPGDGIVLYTDGVTEAFDDYREQYGLERLSDVISANWDKSSADIQKAVIQDFNRHVGGTEILDDYTFMIMKQLVTNANEVGLAK
ncbi:MAG: 7TM diverse intracellular signaling domain-containing protein [Pseudomonadota bacterium]